MFEKSTYINRRKALKNKGLKGLGLFLGNIDSPMNYNDNTFHFRQDSSFLYFFGLDFQGLAGIIDFETGEEHINMPFITCFLFTCIKGKTDPYQLIWSSSLN